MELSKYKAELKKIGYGISADQVINSRGDVMGQCDPYGGFICDVKEIMDIINKKPVKKATKKVRARDEDGHFVADDPSTPDVNEAWKEV